MMKMTKLVVMIPWWRVCFVLGAQSGLSRGASQRTSDPEPGRHPARSPKKPRMPTATGRTARHVIEPPDLLLVEVLEAIAGPADLR